jgi:hypothetical protein
MKNKLLRVINGALMALLLSSCQSYQPIHRAQTEYSQVGSVDGLVFPKNNVNCIPMSQAPRDPPLPKNVPNATWYNTGSPPIRYQKDVTVTIHFQSPEKIDRDSQGPRSVCGSAVFAYTNANNKTMHMPNPCTYPQTDAYARLMCHEMGHVNGWPGYHGD